MGKEIVVFNARTTQKSGSFFISGKPKFFTLRRLLGYSFIALSLAAFILFLIPITSAELNYRLLSYRNRLRPKKDGSLEDFDRNKVSSGAVKSGASSAEAESIAAQVETWAQSAAVDGVVKSSDIRAKVLELLRAVNPEAADNFAAYKKA